jgi:pyruvate/2-oxoglutarate dehydrogenase complex dihydrolipoamide acyltransferase (E2) component
MRISTPSLPRRAPGLQPRTGFADVKVVGLRRKIAEKMPVAHAGIPHITYVKEVDARARGATGKAQCRQAERAAAADPSCPS